MGETHPGLRPPLRRRGLLRTITKIAPAHHPINFAKILSYSLLFSALDSLILVLTL